MRLLHEPSAHWVIEQLPLKLPWYWNRKNVSCIPFGQYGGSIRTDGNRGWRIQLTGVPGRTVAQVHVGNYPRQIEGCILVGTSTCGSPGLVTKISS